MALGSRNANGSNSVRLIAKRRARQEARERANNQRSSTPTQPNRRQSTSGGKSYTDSKPVSPTPPTPPTPKPSVPKSSATGPSSSSYSPPSRPYSYNPPTSSNDTTSQPLSEQAAAIGISGVPESGFISDPMPPLTGTIDEVIVPDARSSPVYQQQVAQLAQALSNFRSSQSLAKNQYLDQYQGNLHEMGWNPQKDMWMEEGPGAFANDWQNNEGGFAGRGTYYSGPHIEASQDLTQNYNEQKTDMDQARNRFVQNQQAALAQMQQQNQLARQRALADAVARIAAQQGVSFSDVPGSKQVTS